MSSKSEAGMTLYRINRDIGVANTIFMVNSHGQTGYKKNAESDKKGRNERPHHQGILYMEKRL